MQVNPGTVGRIHVGISGWRYAPWRGVFYPTGLSQDRELEFASRALPTIELNGSFYSLQSPESYARWHAETPEAFVFAVKGARFIDRWATRIRASGSGDEPRDAVRVSAPATRRSLDVYCYFDNDVKVRAPFDAQRLMEKLGLDVPSAVPRARLRRVAKKSAPRAAAPVFFRK